MARYSRRRGPAANFELVIASTLVPGMTITRYYDNGELLILAHITCNNASAAQTNIQIDIRLDGAPISPNIPRTSVPIGLLGEMAVTHLVPITEGTHTIELFSSGGAAVGDVLEAGRCELVVIQLPLWDSDADILTL